MCQSQLKHPVGRTSTITPNYASRSTFYNQDRTSYWKDMTQQRQDKNDTIPYMESSFVMAAMEQKARIGWKQLLCGQVTVASWQQLLHNCNCNAHQQQYFFSKLIHPGWWGVNSVHCATAQPSSPPTQWQPYRPNTSTCNHWKYHLHGIPGPTSALSFDSHALLQLLLTQYLVSFFL